MEKLTSSPSSLLELYQPEWMRDPYALYRFLRERTPIYWDDIMATWVVLRHADIVELSRDPRLSEDRVTPFFNRLSPERRAGIAPLAHALGNMMLFNNPPRHTILRGMMREAFTRRAIEELRPSIQAKVAGLLDQAVPRGRLEVIGDLAEPLAQGVIADLLDFPHEDRHLLAGWTSLLHEFFMQSAAEVDRIGRIRRVFDRILARRRRAPGTDLVSRMIAARGEFEATDDELFANFLLIIDAGQVTTSHLIANGLRALLQHPDQMSQLRARPELLPNAVNELMRFDSSVQFTTRIAAADIEAGEHLIGPDEPVTLVLGSGNRDPEKFAEPDRLDITRPAKEHLSFGFGPHYCLGAGLGLVEIQAALGALLARVRELRLDSTEARWRESINFRFLVELPVSFEAVA
jgi:cytochrome P450